jgi:hypothetical protein
MGVMARRCQSGLVFQFLGGFGVMVLRQQQVEGRHHEQGEQGADGEAGGDDQAHVEATCGTGTAGDHQRHDAQHHGRGGHQDRAQTGGSSLFDGFALGLAGALQFVGKFDDQDAVLGDQAHQGNQTNLGVDVERGRPAR